jgi:OmpA-OmpF porin, OOP family
VPERDGDGDGDGVRDAEDFCLAAAEDIDRCDDEDGCPEDDDHDGTPDSSDACRHTQGPTHNKGCPVPPPPGTLRVIVSESGDHCLILNPVPFSKGSAALSPEAETVVGWTVNCMVNEPNLLVLELLGYSPPQEKAPDLALERAQAVQSALIARGIDGRRLRVGRGDSARPFGIGNDPYVVQFLVRRSLSCPASLDYLKD